MNDQLHAAGFIEEALEHDRILRRQRAECCVAGTQIVEEFARGSIGETHAARKSGEHIFSRRILLKALHHLGTETRDRVRQLVAAARRLAEPERKRRRLAMRVLDADGVLLHADDAIGVIAELEDVAGHALDREVFVQRADEDVLRIEQDLVIGVVRDRTAGGNRGQPRAASRGAARGYTIMMDPARHDVRAAW
jgi:hypothetical protein